MAQWGPVLGIAVWALLAQAVLADPAPAPTTASQTPSPPSQQAVSTSAPTDAASSATPTSPPAPCCQVSVGTPVVIELTELVGTKTQKTGDHFGLRLAEPLVVNGQIVAEAGDVGVGEVIWSAPPGMSGKPAKLVLAARYVVQNGVQIPLRSFRLGGAGHNNEDVSTAIAMASAAPGLGPLAIVSLAIPGGNVQAPAGTRASAKVAADLTLPPLGAAPPATSDPTSGASASGTGSSSVATSAPPTSDAANNQKGTPP